MRQVLGTLCKPDPRALTVLRHEHHASSGQRGCEPDDCIIGDAAAAPLEIHYRGQAKPRSFGELWLRPIDECAGRPTLRRRYQHFMLTPIHLPCFVATETVDGYNMTPQRRSFLRELMTLAWDLFRVGNRTFADALAGAWRWTKNSAARQQSNAVFMRRYRGRTVAFGTMLQSPIRRSLTGPYRNADARAAGYVTSMVGR